MSEISVPAAHFLDALDSEGYVKPHRRRDVALALASYATNGGAGRNLGDAVHEEITEGRRKANEERRAKGSPEVPYYSCCDLVHWLLARLGCTDERLVNRTDDSGERDWQVAVNLSRITGSPHFVRPRHGETPSPGDALVLDASGGHACIVRRWEGGLCESDDYGQPYGARRQRRVEPDGRGGWIAGGRPVIGWLDLEAVPLEGPAALPVQVEEGL